MGDGLGLDTWWAESAYKAAQGASIAALKSADQDGA